MKLISSKIIKEYYFSTPIHVPNSATILCSNDGLSVIIFNMVEFAFKFWKKKCVRSSNYNLLEYLSRMNGVQLPTDIVQFILKFICDDIYLSIVNDFIKTVTGKINKNSGGSHVFDMTRKGNDPFEDYGISLKFYNTQTRTKKSMCDISFWACTNCRSNEYRYIQNINYKLIFIANHHRRCYTCHNHNDHYNECIFSGIKIVEKLWA